MIVASKEQAELADLLGEARVACYRFWKAASAAAGREFPTFQEAEAWVEAETNKLAEYAAVSSQFVTYEDRL